MRTLTILSLILVFFTLTELSFGQVPQNKNGQILPSPLDSIEIKPNPYSVYNFYESGQTVALENLPGNCQVSIYSYEGTLVSTHFNPTGQSKLEWELYDSDHVPVRSAVYFVHIDAGELGKKILKFFVIVPNLDGPSFY